MEQKKRSALQRIPEFFRPLTFVLVGVGGRLRDKREGGAKEKEEKKKSGGEEKRRGGGDEERRKKEGEGEEERKRRRSRLLNQDSTGATEHAL